MEFNEKEVRECYRFLAHKGFTELRLLDPKKEKPPISEFPDNEESFVDFCKQWNGKRNIYAGINERILKGREGKDVISVKTIVVDIDAIRPSPFEQSPATEKEIEEARQVMNKIINSIKESKQTLPVQVYTGNGYQLWFAIPEIFIDDKNRKQIESKLQLFQDLIKNKFDTEKGHIDKIGDLPRIIKVWGTFNIKGNESENRKHKLCKLLSEGVRIENEFLSKQILELEEINYSFIENKIEKIELKFLPIPIKYLFKDYQHKSPEGWMRIVEVFASFFRGIGLERGKAENQIILWSRRQPYREQGEEGEIQKIVERIYKNEIMCPNFKKLVYKEEGYPFFGLKKKFQGIELHPEEWERYVNPVVYYNAKKEESKKEVSDYALIWEKELYSYEMEEKDWIIENLIPSRSIGVWTGKRGSMKTFLVLNAISCVCSEKLFLNRFATSKGKVIYLDKENGVLIMKNRMPLIKKGLELEEDDLDIGFICFSNLKIDKLNDLGKIEEIIKEHKPNLFVVDTYRRGISFEENDAGAVSKLFVDQLRPLVEKYGTTILLIHHDRKGEVQGDEMDMIRGSSDLANYADFILKNVRKGNNLILKQLKMRNAPEHKDIEITVESNEDSHISFISSGDYEPQTRDMKCAEILTIWIMKQGMDQFETKEAKEIAFAQGIKKQNFFNGLQLLVDNGLVQKETKGVYTVVSKNTKLIV